MSVQKVEQEDGVMAFTPTVGKLCFTGKDLDKESRTVALTLRAGAGKEYTIGVQCERDSAQYHDVHPDNPVYDVYVERDWFDVSYDALQHDFFETKDDDGDEAMREFCDELIDQHVTAYDMQFLIHALIEEEEEDVEEADKVEEADEIENE